VKDTLLSSERVWAESEEADVEVALESLGYVASKAAQRADRARVEEALGRAGKASHAKLLSYSPETRTATFRAALASPDARLELEEAVADELGSLVEDGKVALPTLDRRVPVGRTTTSAERALARTRLDVAASKTLLRSGCTATWEFAGEDVIRVSLVPMSEQDGRAVDPYVDAFSREVQVIFGRPPAAAEPVAGGLDAWLRLARSTDRQGKSAEKKAPEAPPSSKKGRTAEAPPSSKKAARTPEAPPSSKKGRTAEAPPSSKKAAPASKRAAAPAPAKKTAEKKAKSPAKKVAAGGKPAAKEPKAAAKKAAPAKKAASPAAKKAAKTASRR
jgi:hypothetical protein